MYTLLLIFALVSIIFSFLCSVWEAVLLSIPPSYVQIQAQSGTRTGSLLQQLKKDIDRPLSAILTLNTIAHTVGAIGVGAQASNIWGASDGLDVLGIHIGAEAIVATLMTLAILILSEIIPKTIGATYWKNLTSFTAFSVDFITKILLPLVWLSQIITKFLKKNKDESIFDRADFTAMAEIGAREGSLQKGESRIIRNLLRFESITAEDIMTPRTVVKTADQHTTIRAFYDQNPMLQFSRIPVFMDSKDDINGYVLKDEILASLVNNEGDKTLNSIQREIHIVNERLPLPELFNLLIERREHISLVVDEFGGMAGIVTMEDVIETLIGLEIVDEMDSTTDMQILARKNWEHRARELGIINEDEEQS